MKTINLVLELSELEQNCIFGGFIDPETLDMNSHGSKDTIKHPWDDLLGDICKIPIFY